MFAPPVAKLQSKTSSSQHAVVRERSLTIAPEQTSHEHEADAFASSISATAASKTPTRQLFESRLGFDLSRVRIHADESAAAAARGAGARSFTIGNHIVFGAGEYRPSSHDGLALLAHELMHVRQNSDGGESAHWLQRKPCPSCHKPEGTQEVQTQDATEDDKYYMPEDAVPVLTELIEGFYWGMYDNCMRKSLRSVRLADYDGTTRVVGYVMTFEDPRGSNFPHPIVVIDVYGKEIRHSYSDPEAIESVLSPIDFIGPGFLTKPVLGGARALGRGLVETAPKFGAFVGKNARNLAFSARMTMADSLTATMRGGEQFAALTAESAAPSALIVREGGEFVASSQAARAATNVTESLSTVGVPPPPMPVTGPSFASVSTHLGPQALGTVAYGSTAAAASGALAANLVTADTPGFQTHSTASSVRGAFNVSGKDFESAHIVPQTVYRALRARGLLGAGASEGRALTTLLAKDAHRAFDRGWVNQWHSAVDAGRQITVGDAYTWLRNAINNVGDNLISNDVKGAMLLRLDAELFQDLGLSLSDVIVAARP